MGFVYSSSEDGQGGQFGRLAPDGSVALPPVEFSPFANHFAIATLANGDVVVAHQAGPDPTAARLDPNDGAVLSSRPLLFPDGWAITELDAATLPSGEVLVVATGTDFLEASMYASIVATDGTVRSVGLLDNSSSGAEGAYALDIAQFGSGAVGVFTMGFADEGTLVILNGEGALLPIRRTFVEPGSSPQSITATGIAGGDVLVAYRSGGTDNTAFYRIVEDLTWKVGSEVAFAEGDGIVGQAESVTLPDGTTALAYARTSSFVEPYPGELLFMR